MTSSVDVPSRSARAFNADLVDVWTRTVVVATNLSLHLVYTTCAVATCPVTGVKAIPQGPLSRSGCRSFEPVTSSEPTRSTCQVSHERSWWPR